MTSITFSAIQWCHIDRQNLKYSSICWVSYEYCGNVSCKSYTKIGYLFPNGCPSAQANCLFSFWRCYLFQIFYVKTLHIIDFNIVVLYLNTLSGETFIEFFTGSTTNNYKHIITNKVLECSHGDRYQKSRAGKTVK